MPTNKIEESDVNVPKFFRELSGLLTHLHDAGTERDRAGNRRLFYDQVCVLILLYMFNPIFTSLRSLQRASNLKKVQKTLGCPRSSLASLGEALRVFDPDLLLPVIEQLHSKLGTQLRDNRISEIDKTITLVDGSVIKALPSMAEAAFRKDSCGNGTIRWRLHTQFELLPSNPTRIDLTRDAEKGQDERVVLARKLEPGRCYVGDRGYVKTQLFNDIHGINSNYVIRVKDTTTYDVVEDHELSEEARELRVLSDQVVELYPAAKVQPDHPTRLIIIQKKAHKKHHSYKKTGPACDGYLRIVTDMMDVPAEVIAILYEYRWAVEIFFRNLKHVLGCRSLLSRDENGIRIQIYCAIIACMLITLWTGKTPTLRTVEIISLYLTGWADDDELQEHLDKLKPQK